MKSIRDFISGSSSLSMNLVHWSLVGIIWLIYILAFPTLYEILGAGALSFSVLPVFVTSWKAGLVGGVISAGLFTIINGLMMGWMGDHAWSNNMFNNLQGFLLLLLAGAIVGRMRDLSRMLVKELIEKERTGNKYRRIVESSIDGVVLVNEEGKISEWNRGQEQITGLKREFVLGKFIWDIFYKLQPDTKKVPTIKDQFKEAVMKALQVGESYWLNQLSEREIQQSDGTRFFVQVRKYPIKTDKGYMIGIFSRDITERKETEQMLLESEERFRATVSQSSDGILIADENLKIIEWSSSQTEIYGYTREEMLDKPIWQFQYDVVPEDQRPPGLLEHAKERSLKVKETGAYHQEEMKKDYEIQVKDGSRKTVQISSFPITTSSGTLYGAFTRDISEQKNFEHHLQHTATHDSLTDLPNRILLNDRLIHSLSKAERNGEQLAILYIDLDNFKDVNDTFGHAAGDFLLQQFTNRIQDQTRKCDTIARISGDEFIIIVESLTDSKYATKVAEKVIMLGKEPYFMDDKEIQTTLSIGISLFPDDGTDPAILIQRADAAMYRAKRAGKNNLQYYKSL